MFLDPSHGCAFSSGFQGENWMWVDWIPIWVCCINMYLWQDAVTSAQYDYTADLLYLPWVLPTQTGRVRKPYCHYGQPRFSAFLLQIRGRRESIHEKEKKNQTTHNRSWLKDNSSNQHQGMQWRHSQWNSHIYLVIQGRNYYLSWEIDLVGDVSTLNEVEEVPDLETKLFFFFFHCALQM